MKSKGGSTSAWGWHSQSLQPPCHAPRGWREVRAPQLNHLVCACTLLCRSSLTCTHHVSSTLSTSSLGRLFAAQDSGAPGKWWRTAVLVSFLCVWSARKRNISSFSTRSRSSYNNRAICRAHVRGQPVLGQVLATNQQRQLLAGCLPLLLVFYVVYVLLWCVKHRVFSGNLQVHMQQGYSTAHAHCTHALSTILNHSVHTCCRRVQCLDTLSELLSLPPTLQAPALQQRMCSK